MNHSDLNSMARSWSEATLAEVHQMEEVLANIVHAATLRTDVKGHTSIKDKFKLALGALLFPQQALRWRRFLEQHAQLNALAQQYPRLRHKIYRPYLSRHLGCAHRATVLIDHYSAIFTAGLGALLGAAASAPVTIAAFAGKSGDAFELRLAAMQGGHREGELVLQLIHQGTYAYSATFSLLMQDGALCITLGGLQGLGSSGSPLIIKRITRELFRTTGLPPVDCIVRLSRPVNGKDGPATNRALKAALKVELTRLFASQLRRPAPVDAA